MSNSTQSLDQTSAAHMTQQPLHSQVSGSASTALNTHTFHQPLHPARDDSALTASYQLLHAYLNQSAEQDPPQDPPEHNQAAGPVQQRPSSPVSPHYPYTAHIEQHSPASVSVSEAQQSRDQVSVSEARQVAAKLAASVTIQSPVQSPAQSPVHSQSSPQSMQDAVHPLDIPVSTHQQLEAAAQLQLSGSGNRLQHQLPAASEFQAPQAEVAQLPDNSPQPSQPHASMDSAVSPQPVPRPSSADSEATVIAEPVFADSDRASDLQEQRELAHALMSSLQDQGSGSAPEAWQALASACPASGPEPRSGSALQEQSPSNSLAEAAYTDSYASPVQGDSIGYHADSPASTPSSSSSSSSSSASSAPSLKPSQHSVSRSSHAAHIDLSAASRSSPDLIGASSHKPGSNSFSSAPLHTTTAGHFAADQDRVASQAAGPSCTDQDVGAQRNDYVQRDTSQSPTPVQTSSSRHVPLEHDAPDSSGRGRIHGSESVPTASAPQPPVPSPGTVAQVYTVLHEHLMYHWLGEPM